MGKFVFSNTKRKISILLFCAMLLSCLFLPKVSSAATFDKNKIYIEPICKIYSFSPEEDSIAVLPFVIYPNEIEHATKIPCLKNTEFLFITSYAYGDMIDNNSTEYEDGIKSLSISLFSMLPCDTESKTIYQDYILPYGGFNILPLENLEDGLYKLTIKITTAGNGYYNFFNEVVEKNNIFSFYFNINTNYAIEKHTETCLSPKFFIKNEKDEKKIFENTYIKNAGKVIQLSELSTLHVTHESFFSFYDASYNIPENVVAFAFAWSNNPDVMCKTSTLDEVIKVSDFLAPNEKAVLYYVYVYDDGCFGKTSDLTIICTDIQNTSLSENN